MTSTELSGTLCVDCEEANMPTRLITPSAQTMKEKASSPTTVAQTDLKKSFICCRQLSL